jgi:hypothetical protein
MDETPKMRADVTARSPATNDGETEPGVSPFATSTQTGSHNAGSPRQDVTNMKGAGDANEPSPTQSDPSKKEAGNQNLDRVTRLGTILMGPAAIGARSIGKALEEAVGTYVKDKEEGKQKGEQLADDLIVSNIPLVGSVMAVRAGATEAKESIEKGRAANAKGENLDAAGHYVDAGLAALETGAIVVGDVVAHAHAPGKISAKVVEPTGPKLVQSKAGGVPHETPRKVSEGTTETGTGPRSGTEKRFERVSAGGPSSGHGERPDVRKKDSTANTPSDVKPDVPTEWVVPIDKISTRKGEAVAPKVNNKEGGYRGVTPNMRKEVQRVGETYQGPGKYDVSHRTPLSHTPPGTRVRLRSEEKGSNRGDGDAIAKSNEMRQKAGLYTRPKAEGYTAKAEAAEKRSEKGRAGGARSGPGERPDVTKKDGSQKGSGDSPTGSSAEKASPKSGESNDNQLKGVKGEDWKGDRRKHPTPAGRGGERGGEGGHG